MSDQLADDLELLAKLRRQMPEVEAEVDRIEELLANARSNVDYVRDGYNEVFARVCNVMMPPNTVVRGPAPPEPNPPPKPRQPFNMIDEQTCEGIDPNVSWKAETPAPSPVDMGGGEAAIPDNYPGFEFKGDGYSKDGPHFEDTEESLAENASVACALANFHGGADFSDTTVALKTYMDGDQLVVREISASEMYAPEPQPVADVKREDAA